MARTIPRGLSPLTVIGGLLLLLAGFAHFYMPGVFTPDAITTRDTEFDLGSGPLEVVSKVATPFGFNGSDFQFTQPDHELQKRALTCSLVRFEGLQMDASQGSGSRSAVRVSG
ncbi:MAG: hypothetical protein Q9171_001826 [Xanthocarpia ochracea]